MASPQKIQAKVSIIAPMHNEELVIAQYIEQTLSTLEQHFENYELILIDDGSTDRSLEISSSYAQSRKGMRIISFTRNYGHEIASTAGLDASSGDYAILMDADLQHPPALIPELVQKALEGYDVVYAKRTHRNNESWIKRKLALMFYYIAKKMTGFELGDQAGNFRLVSRRVIESLSQFKENNRHLLMLFAYVGFDTASVSFECAERLAGYSKYSYRKRINLAIDSIISFSHRPLRIMSILSILISFILTGYAGYILLEKLFYYQNLAKGVASVIFITSGLFAILFLFLAIISEYISRILTESKNRPLYYVKKEYASKNDGD